MTKDELIVKQQIEIEDLKEEISVLDDQRHEICIILFGADGPLKSNKLHYTEPHLKLFDKIAKVLNL